MLVFLCLINVRKIENEKTFHDYLMSVHKMCLAEIQQRSEIKLDFELYEIYREYCFSSFGVGTIHKVCTLTGGGRGLRQKRITNVFMMSFYGLKVYKGKEGI